MPDGVTWRGSLGFRFAVVLALGGMLGLGWGGLGVVQAQEDAEEGPAAGNPLDQVRWTLGPDRGVIGNRAEIEVPDGFRFTDGDGARILLTAMENPTDGSELGLIGPLDLAWFVTFEYDDSGHVDDKDKGSLDAKSMLASIQEGTRRSNEERKRRGWGTVEVVGFEVEPHYDARTNNLEWAIRGRSEGHDIVNHNTRLLGRTGVMRVGLVCGPDDLDATMPRFRELLSTYSFSGGHRYAEYREGDKLATYGLAALVTGAAAAAAVNSGVAAKAGKGIVKLLVLIGAGIAGVFGKLFGRSKPKPDGA